MIQTTIGVGGMACEMCEAHINDAIRKAFPVKSAKSDRRKKQCVVVSEEPLDEALAAKAITDAGYDFLSIASEPYQKKGLLGPLSALRTAHPSGCADFPWHPHFRRVPDCLPSVARWFRRIAASPPLGYASLMRK